MDCTIPATSVKTFIKTITFLSKIGDAISFEVTPSRFILRTLGDGESSYVQLDFETNIGVFFAKYDCYYHEPENENENENNDNQSINSLSTSAYESTRTVKVRIKSKIFLSAFRLGDQAQTIDFKFKTDVNKLEIILTFAYDIRRKYSLRFEDIPTIMQAEFDCSHQSLQQIHCTEHTFKRVLTNFAHTLAEITLILSEQGIAIKSYIDSAEVTTNDSIQTECHLKASNVDQFLVNLPSSVQQIILTVVQKEFKAFLGLCQSLHEPIKMYFTVGGAPLLLTNVIPVAMAHNNSETRPAKGIYIRLIMATICDDVDMPQQPNAPISNTQKSSNSNRSSHSRFSEATAKNARRIRRENNANNNNGNQERDQLAQVQASPQSVSDFNNRGSVSQSESVHLDDDEVIIGIPTHGNFGNGDTVHTTQRVTVQNGSEAQSSNNTQRKRTTSSAFRRALQPHPRSLTPQNNSNDRLQNEGNMFGVNTNRNKTGDFGVNEPMNDRKGKSERERRILPESSNESGRNVINLIDDGEMNSLEVQCVSNGLSSFLDSGMTANNEMTQTQRIEGGQIADRFHRQRQNKKRRLAQEHYGKGNVNVRGNKRQRYNHTLTKKPKSKWKDSDSPI